MLDKKTYIAGAIALIIVGLIVFWGLKQPEKASAPTISQESQDNASQQNQSTDIIYYYGEECPHCKDVAKFLEDNKITEKTVFSKKEVWHNAANAAEMQKRGEECNLQKQGMGVPFLYAKGKCYIGTPDVEAFFRQEAGI